MSTNLAFNAKTKRDYLITLLLIPLLLFSRPVGVFYCIALIFIVLKRHQFKFASLFLFSALAFVFSIVLFYLPLHFNDFALPIFQGSVICGFPTFPNSVLLEGNYTLAEVYLAFLREHDFFTLLNLSCKKVVTFFAITRPYYSFGHNAINSLYYVFILGGLIGIIDMLRRKTAPFFSKYFISVFISSLIIVVLIYNEWSERFMVPLLPFFILITFIFISKIRVKKSEKTEEMRRDVRK